MRVLIAYIFLLASKFFGEFKQSWNNKIKVDCHNDESSKVVYIMVSVMNTNDSIVICLWVLILNGCARLPFTSCKVFKLVDHGRYIAILMIMYFTHFSCVTIEVVIVSRQMIFILVWIIDFNRVTTNEHILTNQRWWIFSNFIVNIELVPTKVWNRDFYHLESFSIIHFIFVINFNNSQSNVMSYLDCLIRIVCWINFKFFNFELKFIFIGSITA